MEKFDARITLVLYRTRASGKECGERLLVRAFDKAVRRKPLAFAADAVGLWELNVGGGGTRLTWRALSACAQGASGATEGSEQCRILALVMAKHVEPGMVREARRKSAGRAYARGLFEIE